MCRRRCARPRKPPTRMTIPRENGEGSPVSASTDLRAIFSEDRRQFQRRDDFKLGIRAILRLLIGTPPAELREMPESPALHVFIRDFNNQFRPQRFPRQILTLAPAALAAGHSMT